jgi:hypothetical protein
VTEEINESQGIKSFVKFVFLSVKRNRSTIELCNLFFFLFLLYQERPYRSVRGFVPLLEKKSSIDGHSRFISVLSTRVAPNMPGRIETYRRKIELFCFQERSARVWADQASFRHIKMCLNSTKRVWVNASSHVGSHRDETEEFLFGGESVGSNRVRMHQDASRYIGTRRHMSEHIEMRPKSPCWKRVGRSGSRQDVSGRIEMR